ncbi:recombinase family protein [Shewanella marisflavi]|uniref:recombinase family protein n=1 Tax=Shewanella marisflavi TaxID=260364 RepID=UPI00200F1287|nr:recombinase family protein [Shewanella marisflavi]MCL1042382.1 recombinase family protein [Shewanella marisflavi]
MPKAIPYIRFSSAIQERGSSLERQENLINEYLKSHTDVELSALQYKDLGISGYKGKHLENDLGKLLAAIEANHIVSGDRILVESMDRLGRLPEMEMISLLNDIIKHGVKVITLQDGVEYSKEALSTNAGLLYQLVGKVQMAHQYSEQLSVRVKAAWTKKKRLAQKGEGVKRKAPWWITWNESTQRYDVVTDADKEILGNVFRWYLSGLGERRILGRLRDAFPEKFGTTDPATVKRWLRNKTAIGYWGDIAGVYPPAIEESLYYQVQAELLRRADGHSQPPRSGHLLCGLVKCGVCGGNFSMRSNKHSTDAMHCSIGNKRKDKCTNNKTIPVQILDWVRYETFVEAIQEISKNANNKDAEEKLAIVKGRIVEVEAQIENFLVLVGMGSKTAPAKVIELEQQLEQLQGDESELLLQIRTPSELSYADAMLEGSDMMDDPELLNNLLRQVSYNITVIGNKITYKDRVWEYVKWSRAEDCYHMRQFDLDCQLIEEFTLPVARPMEDTDRELLEGEPQAVMSVFKDEKGSLYRDNPFIKELIKDL